MFSSSALNDYRVVRRVHIPFYKTDDFVRFNESISPTLKTNKRKNPEFTKSNVKIVILLAQTGRNAGVRVLKNALGI